MYEQQYIDYDALRTKVIDICQGNLVCWFCDIP